MEDADDENHPYYGQNEDPAQTTLLTNKTLEKFFADT